eukprot:TRINITY_DN9155_c0_g1_i2.p1 TRINITY_DN9155_c0_g1~~TRINITY_DN9155_c0_g1_i2.p1  ORF type:complete len:218 (+),score=65.00 TRINITY_DN9155_c0_g1_i2:58-711(+)
MGCCSSAPSSSNTKQMKNAPEAAAAPGAQKTSTRETRLAAMKEFVAVSDRKSEQIISSSDNDQVMRYLMNVSDLLKAIRDQSRFEATSKLEAAFDAYDTQPADGKLSVLESNEFINDYYECMESFIAKLYRVGLELVEPDNKAKHADSTKRVVDLFKKKREELNDLWHQSCDKNRDGQLQLIEVKEAFLGNGAGDAEQKLGVFINQELNELLFHDGV